MPTPSTHSRPMHLIDLSTSPSFKLTRMVCLPPLHDIYRTTLIACLNSPGYARTYIVLPSTIYGLASNPLVAAGIANPHSVALPILIRVALARGRAGQLGEGREIWGNVHIDDTADLYMVLADAIMGNSDSVDRGDHGYYIAENGEHTWAELSEAIGRALVELGVQKEAKPSQFTDEELIQFFGSVVSSSSSDVQVVEIR